jgi:hypothetical protein
MSTSNVLLLTVPALVVILVATSTIATSMTQPAAARVISLSTTVTEVENCHISGDHVPLTGVCHRTSTSKNSDNAVSLHNERQEIQEIRHTK